MYPAATRSQQQQSAPPVAAAARSNYDRSADSDSFFARPSEKQASGFDDDDHARYPSLANDQLYHQPTAPSFDSNSVPHALPMYYNQQQQQQQPYQAHTQQYGYPTHPTHPPPSSSYQQHHQRLLPPMPPMPPMQYVSPVRSGDYRRHTCLGTTLKLVIFHLLNAILGIAGFVIVISGANISIGLIPLCCIGIIAFRGVLYLVSLLAKFDVKLYNYISPASEHVYVDIPQEARFFGRITGERLSPQLSSFSPLAITAALYFATIKFAVGILSCIVVSLTGGLLVGFAMVLSGLEIDGRPAMISLGNRSLTIQESPIEFVVVWVCLLVISIALMHVVARVSRASTRFFCCEKFSTYRYIHVAQHARAPVTVNYGSY